MPHWRPPGWRESGQEASPPSIYLTRIRSPADCPCADQHRCAWAGIRSSGGAIELTRYRKLLVFTILHSRAVAYLESNLPVDGARHSRKQRIRQEARCGCAGIRGSGGGPSHPMQCRELPVSINSAFQCSIPGSVRSPGRFQDSALKCSMAAPAATRRLRGVPVEQYPVRVGCATEKVGQWTERPGSTHQKRSHFVQLIASPGALSGQHRIFTDDEHRNERTLHF